MEKYFQKDSFYIFCPVQYDRKPCVAAVMIIRWLWMDFQLPLSESKCFWSTYPPHPYLMNLLPKLIFE